MHDPANPLTLIQAAAYLKEKYGLLRSRQSLYNWATIGVGGILLSTAEVRLPGKLHPVLTTTPALVDQFVRDIALV